MTQQELRSQETNRGGMRYRRLGRTGEEVSIIGLGGHHIGRQKDEKDSIQIIRAAIDAGINFMDNSWDYHAGGSEVRMGKALKDGYRKKVFLMTKIDGRTKEEAAKQIDQSLKRLQTEVIDLYYLHRWDKITPIEEAVGGLGELVREGKIRSIGLSEVSAANLRKAHATHPVAAIQSEYSPWTRNPEIAVGRQCIDAFRSIMIDPDGDIIPVHGRCFRFPVVNVHREGLEGAWNHERLSQLRRTLAKSGGLLPACTRCCSGFAGALQ